MLKHLAATSALAALLAAPLVAEQSSAQKLYVRGAYDEAVRRVNTERAAGNDDPVAAYLAGQALFKLDRNNDARAEFARLANGNDQTWHAIGQSAIGLLDNNLDEAANEGRKARDMSGESGFAFYQLGLVLIKRGEFDEASQVLDRASDLMPEFAYAHYNAGLAHQRAKRFNKMAEHFQVFLQLAPDAPEKRQVQLALNSLRG
jgi:tetratricopeptide (TPR) repeat protein